MTDKRTPAPDTAIEPEGGYRKVRATDAPETDTEAHRFRGGAPVQEPVEAEELIRRRAQPDPDLDADTQGHERR